MFIEQWEEEGNSILGEVHREVGGGVKEKGKEEYP